jgi:hypothetical protein
VAARALVGDRSDADLQEGAGQGRSTLSAAEATDPGRGVLHIFTDQLIQPACVVAESCCHSDGDSFVLYGHSCFSICLKSSLQARDMLEKAKVDNAIAEAKKEVCSSITLWAPVRPTMLFRVSDVNVCNKVLLSNPQHT